MDSFERKVNFCRKNNLPDLIDNAAWGHAGYLFENLLSVAAEKKETVRIVSGHLNKKFYVPLSEKIRECIASGVKIEVVVLKNELIIENHGFAKLVENYKNGKVLVLGKNDVAEIPHMLLIGDKGQRFRLETDHKQTKAVASFNNPNMGQKLSNIYNEFVGNIPQTTL